MSISQDGCLAFWKKGLTLEKSIRLPQADQSKPNKATWITDCVVVPGQNRIFTFTGGTFDHQKKCSPLTDYFSDRDILIYDSISFELYCRISGLDSVPLRVNQYANESKVILIMGDEKGHISLLVLNRFADTLREWKHRFNFLMIFSK